MPAMDSMPLMSLRVFPAFSPFGKPQSLPDVVEPPAFKTIQQSQVRGPFPHEEGWCLPVPTHPLQCAVQRSHQPITHFSTIRIATSSSLTIREGFWSLLSHVPQLSQTLIGPHSVRDRRGDL